MSNNDPSQELLLTLKELVTVTCAGKSQLESAATTGSSDSSCGCGYKCPWVRNTSTTTGPGDGPFGSGGEEEYDDSNKVVLEVAPIPEGSMVA